MRLLIDTHIALWALARPERLPADLARGMREGDFEVFLSLASLWEVAIKHSIWSPEGCASSTGVRPIC